MKKTETHGTGTDRYAFDFGACDYREGWAQVDTAQDASYYGNWLNPTSRKWVSFAEGHCTRIEFETDDEMVEFVRGFCERMSAKIDPMCMTDIGSRLEALGLSDLTH